MKQFIGLLVIIWLFANDSALGQLANQTTTYLTLRRYVLDVRLTDQKTMQSGVLFDLTDSTVVLSPIQGLKLAVNTLIRRHNGTLPPTDSLQTLLSLRTYRYDNISRLALHRRGHAAKGFLIGAGAGILTGLIKGDDEPDFISFPASVYILTFGVLFSAVGLVFGAVNIKSVNAREQSVATEVPARFRKFTIVEQVNQATLYTP